MLALFLLARRGSPARRAALFGEAAAVVWAASQATLLIVDPLASIALGIELFHEHLSAGSGYLAGAVASLAVLGIGVVMLSIWAPPVMTAEELAPLRHNWVHRPKELSDAGSVV